MDKAGEPFWVELPVRSRTLGRPVVVLARELTFGEFSVGTPDVLPDTQTECFSKLNVQDQQSVRTEWERWVDGMLARAILQPRMSSEMVRKLGPDRDLLGKELLGRWGIHRGELMYRKNFLTMVRRFARTMKMLPTDVLALPTSTFWTNYSILFGQDHIDEAFDDAR